MVSPASFDELLLRGDYRAAQSLLQRALVVAPHPITLAKWWTASILIGDIHSLKSSLQDLEHSELAPEQKALLFGHWFHLQGAVAEALSAWNTALSHMPLQQAWAQGRLPRYFFDLMQLTLVHARDATLALQHKNMRLKHTSLDERTEDFIASFFRRNRDDSGLQQPSFMRYPGLRAQPFWDTRQEAWHRQLISKADAIRTELQRYLAHSQQGMTPYVRQTDGAPASWQHLIEKTAWQALHLLKAGHETDIAAAFPQTISALQKTPLSRCGQHAPEAFFSVLQPRTHIPPHYGLSNFKLVAHLPIRLPEHCTLTAGNQTRHWHMKELLVFDDSFLHEANNASNEVRIVLIFDVWHPDLTTDEQMRIQTVMEQFDDLYRRYPTLMTMLKAHAQ